MPEPPVSDPGALVNMRVNPAEAVVDWKDVSRARVLRVHRDERRELAAVEARAVQEATAVAAGDALVAQEQAEKASADSRQAKARRKKQSRKT